MGLVSGNRLNRFWQRGVKPIKDAIGVLSALSTVDKTTLVAAINELAEGKFDVAKLVASTNITEPGFAMDGKTASEAFAELYSKNGYSFEETCIGTWVDGKPLYRKMIDFGTLPSNGEKMQQVDVDNLEFCYIDVGNSLWMDSKWNIFNAKTAPGIFTPIYTTMISTMYYSQKSVYVNTTVASASLYRMYVCIKYTKTTD